MTARVRLTLRWLLILFGTLILAVCLLPFPGLWPFIPFVVVGVWVEGGNLIVSFQMWRELRQVLNGERTEA